MYLLEESSNEMQVGHGVIGWTVECSGRPSGSSSICSSLHSCDRIFFGRRLRRPGELHETVAYSTNLMARESNLWDGHYCDEVKAVTGMKVLGMWKGDVWVLESFIYL